MTRHILLVCGSRDWSDVQRIADELAAYPATREVMHGAARGADAIAGKVAGGWGRKVHARPADWDRLGRRAGPVRNGKMAAELAEAMAAGANVEGLAFGALDRPGNDGRSGTGDMVARLLRIGVSVRWVPTPEGDAKVLNGYASDEAWQQRQQRETVVTSAGIGVDLATLGSSDLVPPVAPVPIHVASARLSYRGQGAMCVARDIVDKALATGKPAPGAAFAPTRALLAMVLPARKEADELLDEAERLNPIKRYILAEQATRIEGAAWDRYRPLYLAGMLISSGSPVPPRWEARVEQALALGFVPDTAAWWALRPFAEASGGLVVFTCFCGPRWRHHCHSRTLCEVLARKGCVDVGEWTPEPKQAGLPGV